MHSFSILTSCFRRQGVKMAFLQPWVVHFLKFANARHLQIYLNQNPNKSLVMIYISCKKPVKSHKSEKSEHLGPHLHLMLHVCAFASVCHQKNRHPKALKVETKECRKWPRHRRNVYQDPGCKNCFSLRQKPGKLKVVTYGWWQPEIRIR